MKSILHDHEYCRFPSTMGIYTNIADLTTKGKAMVADIGEESTWQQGLKEISYARETWLMSHDFK